MVGNWIIGAILLHFLKDSKLNKPDKSYQNRFNTFGHTAWPIL